MDFIKTELRGIFLFLQRNGREAVVLSLAVLVLALGQYEPLWAPWLSNLFYFVALPILVIVVILRKNPLDFGLRWGDFAIWGRYVAVVCLIAAPILFVFSRVTVFEKYYRVEHFDFLAYFLTTCAILFAQEYLYRGFLTFGLKEKLGEAAILVQMVPFVLLHLGKPELETLSTIATGTLFGYIAYRGKSFWPAFFIHMFINIFFVAAINLL
jgi:membrane protease YdiL (CAAX protease family)